MPKYNTKKFIFEFSKYTAASAVALFFDYAAYWLIAKKTALALEVSAAIGYSLGLIVAYALIATKVFYNGWLRERRSLELILFTISGVLGIILTYGSVALYVKVIGDNIHSAKLVAIGISFIGVYLFRKLLVFRADNTSTS